MSVRATEAFDRLVSNNFPPDDHLHKDNRNFLSQAISYTVIPYLAVFGAIVSGMFFVFGLLLVLARATD